MQKTATIAVRRFLAMVRAFAIYQSTSRYQREAHGVTQALVPLRPAAAFREIWRDLAPLILSRSQGPPPPCWYSALRLLVAVQMAVEEKLAVYALHFRQVSLPSAPSTRVLGRFPRLGRRHLARHQPVIITLPVASLDDVVVLPH